MKEVVISFRLLRFFIHASLVVSSLLSSALLEEVQVLTGGQRKNVTEYLVQLLNQDWTILQKLLGLSGFTVFTLFRQEL